MSSSNLRSECRKFAPNIFNKSKCTNCFRQKEEHSAEALESNRASRKVTKCGYLFVAPGWDFSDPLNRTKRWQRRWFVLYDDGELNYSVDEHPDTVPQAVVDMNQVLEVTGAEDVTGHTYSLAITAPDRVHFVKASCREEARWWTDVLTVFARSKGRHKRNATFPGGQATTILQAPTATIRSGTPNPIRPRYNSCHTELGGGGLRSSSSTNWRISPNNTGREEDSIPTRDSDASDCMPPSPPAASTAAVPSTSPTLLETQTVYKDQPASSASPPTRDKLNTEEKARCRQRTTQQRVDRDQHLLAVTSNGGSPTTAQSKGSPPNVRTCDLDNFPSTWRKMGADGTHKDDMSHRLLLNEYEQQTKRDEKLKDIAAVLTRPRSRRPAPSSVPASGQVNTSQTPTRDDVNCSTATPERDVKPKSPTSAENDTVDSVSDKLYRTDSDAYGGFVDLTCHHRYSPSTELRVDLPAEDLLHMKKGWLSKQARDQQWNRHWFVLRGAALTYYRDPNAEDRGIMDGVIDLNGVTGICELQVTRNFGFQLTLWNDSRFLLSAVTSGIRSNWMSVLRRAADIPDSSTSTSQLSPTLLNKEPIIPSTPITPKSILFSSDEEYRTASEGGGRRESGEWCEPLPPSPPLNRTPISRVKERARSRSSSGSRICKRSRSSPPSSRRSTIDSVRTDDLMLPCCGEEPDETDHTTMERLENKVRELRERLENTQSDSVIKVEQQANEIEELKNKLGTALDEISSTEKEVNRLRKVKAEAVQREKRMEELLTTLENTERQLTERAEDMEMLKQMYGQDKELWEQKLSDNELMLRDAAERCEQLSAEVAAGRQTIEHLQHELTHLSDRLARGIDENDALYKRIRDLESRNSTLRPTRGRSVDSLSDLTNIDLEMDLNEMDKEKVIEEYDDLRTRFEKAVHEIRTMKRELRESHIVYDELELTNIKLRQDMKLQNKDDKSQLDLMAARIQDLTVKLTASDKQVRTLKQKLQDSREKRRSLSLKGRESFSIGKEVEEKLTELESKISALETGGDVAIPSSPARTVGARSAPKRSPKREGSIDRQSPTEERKQRRIQARLRRKSLDSATSSEPMKVLIRLSSLESKVSGFSLRGEELVATSTESISQLDAAPISDSETSTPAADRLQALEYVVTTVRERVNECLCHVSLLKSSARSKRNALPLTDKRTGGENYRSIEKCLSDLGHLLNDTSTSTSNTTTSTSTSSSDGIHNSLTCSVSSAELNVISDSVRTVVKSLENTLRSKLTEIAGKRMDLRRSGQFTDRENLQLLAEKLAYESIIVERIKDALGTTTNNNDKSINSRILKSEIMETSHLIANLKRKLNGKCLKRPYSSKTSVEYLTKVLANKLIRYGHVVGQNHHHVQDGVTVRAEREADISDKMLEFLIGKRDEVNTALSMYKATKMEQLANVLAAETLSHASDKELPMTEGGSTTPGHAFDDRRIREAWHLAQETVNNELIQSEISHVMMRCAQLYEGSLTTDHDVFFSFYASERANLELWTEEVESRLRNEMDANVRELTRMYETTLAKLRRQSGGQQWRHHVEQERNVQESRKLLAEFADITAHKALVDARISVLSTDYMPPDVIKAKSQNDSAIEALLEDERYMAKLNDADAVLKSDTVLDAELQFLFQHYCRECHLQLSQADERCTSTSDSAFLRELADSLLLIEKELDKIEGTAMESTHDVQITDWMSVCAKCSSLHHRLVGLTTSVLQRKSCRQCDQLQNTMHRLSSEHEEKVKTLQRNQEENLVELRGALENERASQAQLRERARKLERRLGTLDSEYSQQVESLRTAYNKTLTSAGLDRNLQGEENIRQRYQAEIEQLRALCEKGLVAMESSHRRIIAELEDKHRREREQLRLEKEAALAEETQATLAALDAMRKAHEAEVQREVAKFKAEFVKKMQASPSGQDFGVAFHKENEEEMEEIKQEILSLSDKYSVKCVESAALEEELAKVSSQLSQAQQHIMQLDARNKQLRAHLMSEVAEMDTSALLRARDRPPKTAIHGDGERGIATSTQTADDLPKGPRLSWKVITPGPGVPGTQGVTSRGRGAGCGLQEQRASPRRNAFFAEPPALTIAELIRSPAQQSCPMAAAYRQPVSLCPLAGMVAERKKRFELH